MQKGDKRRWSDLNFYFFNILNVDLMLFEHINILTCLGLPFAHRDIINTVHAYLKTKFNLAFKTRTHSILLLLLKILD